MHPLRLLQTCSRVAGRTASFVADQTRSVPHTGGFHNTENADMGPPPNAPPAPEAAVWPSPGVSHPQPSHVLSRSGSGPWSEAEAARQQAEAGQQAAAKRPAAKPPLTSDEARQQAQAEGLTLLVANSKYNSTTGYFGVRLKNPGKAKPYLAEVRRGGKPVGLGCFATAEEAALCVARTPEGQEAAKRTESRTAEKRPVAAAVKRLAAPLTSEEVRQQARAKGLTLRVAANKAGYFGVRHQPGKSKPYQARVRRGGEQVYRYLNFVTAEEAALCVAQSSEGQEAAKSKASTTAKKRPAAAASARQVAAKVQSFRAAEGDIMAMLWVRQWYDNGGNGERGGAAAGSGVTAAQYDTEGDEAVQVDREAEQEFQML